MSLEKVYLFWSVNKLPQTTRKRRAKRGSGKNFAVIPQDPTITLGTLADDTVILGSQLTLQQDISYKSCDVEISVRNQTPGEGPVLVGLAAPQLTIVEIEEAVDAVPVSQQDYPAIEHARRPVRVIGSFPSITADELLSQGQYRRRIRLPMTCLNDGFLPTFFAYNRSGGPLTTGGIILINAKHYGTWK